MMPPVWEIQDLMRQATELQDVLVWKDEQLITGLS